MMTLWHWLAHDCPGPWLALIVATTGLLAAAGLTALSARWSR